MADEIEVTQSEQPAAPNDISQGGKKLFSGEDKPEWYDKNKDKKAIDAIKGAFKKTDLSDGGAINHR